MLEIKEKKHREEGERGKLSKKRNRKIKSERKMDKCRPK
jgi:hypothetical protein